MHLPCKLVSIFALAALAACDVHDDSHHELASAQASELRNDATQPKINATTPEMLSRSYRAILGTMSADQRDEFLKALAALLKASGQTHADADAAFRSQIDGKTASTIIAEAQISHKD